MNPTMPKKIKLPSSPPPIPSHANSLPYQGTIVSDNKLSFSFAAYDRSHKLFNLGDNTEKSGVVSGKWFLDLLDCLKSMSNMTISEMKTSIHDLHPVDWNNANTSKPAESEQCEYWQFRINKSKGRVIGIKTDGVFYIVWLDPHHNLTNSKGYGTENWYKPARSIYETQEETIHGLQEENRHLREEINTYEELFKETQSPS